MSAAKTLKRSAAAAVRAIGSLPVRFVDTSAEFLHGGSRFGWNLIGLLSALLGVTVVVGWVQGSYLGINLAATLSYLAGDEWCAIGRESLGNHCWGDFASIRFDSFSAVPTGPEAVYPISSRLIRLPFLGISAVFGYQAALIVFVVTSFLCLVVPALWAVRSTGWPFAPIVVTIIAIATTPLLMAWDRGNVLALAVPFLFLAVLGFVRDKPWLLVVATIVAASVKPQFALIAFALLATRQWRPAIAALAGSVAVVLLPFLIFRREALSELFGWLERAQDWSTSQALVDFWPGNVSFAHALYLLVHSSPLVSLEYFSELPDENYAQLALVFAAIISLVLVIFGRSLPRILLVSAFLCVASLSSIISYTYYFVFILPIAAVLFRLGLPDWHRRHGLGVAVLALFGLAIVLGLTPLLVPVPGTVATVADGSITFGPLLPLLSTVCWAAFLCTAAVLSVMNRRATTSLHTKDLDDSHEAA